MDLVKNIVDVVKSVLPERRPIGHHDSYIGDLEKAYVTNCLIEGATGYHYIKKFEKALGAYCGVDNVITMSSGTAALHVALVAAGVKPGDEVLVPALTFAGTASAVCQAGAVPHFIDCGLVLNPFKLRQYLGQNEIKAKAIIIVHLLGVPADMEQLIKIAKGHNLIVIEDAAEALGSQIGNRRCGSFGDVSILSFNCNKIVTTGGGGALLTNDPWIAAKAWQLSTTARVLHPWLVEHDAVAYNYRMPNINAAMGLAQLEQIDVFLEKKRKLAEQYRRAFDDPGLCVSVVAGSDGINQSNNWLNAILLNSMQANLRDEVLGALHNEGIYARAIFTPLTRLPMYKHNPRSGPMFSAENTWKRMICLPSGVGLVP